MEGEQNWDGGEIPRVKVSVDYKDGKTHTFWAKNSDSSQGMRNNWMQVTE